MSDSTKRFQPGDVTGSAVTEILRHANEKNYALPAVNVVGSDSVNGVLEAASAVNSPVIIQFSTGDAAFYAGKGLSNTNQTPAIAGAISGALHVPHMAKHYGDRKSVVR